MDVQRRVDHPQIIRGRSDRLSREVPPYLCTGGPVVRGIRLFIMAVKITEAFKSVDPSLESLSSTVGRDKTSSIDTG